MSQSHNKIDLKHYFEENFDKIKEFQFLYLTKIKKYINN